MRVGGVVGAFGGLSVTAASSRKQRNRTEFGDGEVDAMTYIPKTSWDLGPQGSAHFHSDFTSQAKPSQGLYSFPRPSIIGKLKSAKRDGDANLGDILGGTQDKGALASAVGRLLRVSSARSHPRNETSKKKRGPGRAKTRQSAARVKR